MSDAIPIKRDNRGQWLPGQSANPGGRPAVARELRAQLREACPGAIASLVTIASDPTHPHCVMACALVLRYAIPLPKHQEADRSEPESREELEARLRTYGIDPEALARLIHG